MAVKASGSVTVASITDVASTTRYYLLQASTLTAPAAPTASPPGGSWSATEPTYSEGSTNSLYTCDQTVFSDGTWSYSSVSLSSSYEAAKAAYNKAVAAANTAAATDQHFWADTDGAHVSSTGDHDTSGFHQLMTSVKNAFMRGTTELMTISEDLIELGKNSTSAAIKFCGGLAKIKAQAGSNFSAVFLGTTTPSTMGGIYLTRDVDDITGATLNDAAKGCIGIDKGNGMRTAVHLCAQDLTVVPSTTTQGGTYDMARFATMLSDTGWKWLANYGSGDGVRWRCVAGVVYVQAAIYGEHTVGSGVWGAGTIPAAYRPSSDVAVAGVSFGALTSPTQLRVGSNGSVSLWAPSDTTYFGGSLSYPLEA